MRVIFWVKSSMYKWTDCRITRGEIKNANRDAKELRDKPDQTGKYAAEVAGYFTLSPAPDGGITLSDQRAIDAIRQFSEELDAQQEQTQ